MIPFHVNSAIGWNSVNSSFPSPLDSGKVKRWYRLAASTPVSSEYETVAEVLGGTAITQTSANRKPATATSNNGLPVATFDGTDVWLQTLETGNNGTDKWWILCWVKFADFGAAQAIHDVAPAIASSRRSKLQVSAGTGQVLFDIFVSGFNGRRYTTTGTLSSGTWQALFVQFDNTKTNECDTTGSSSDSKLRIFFGSTAQAITATDSGTGGVPTALLSATGVAVIGGSGDSDTPTTPLRNGGQFGPNMFFGEEPLTTSELANLLAFEAPT